MVIDKSMGRRHSTEGSSFPRNIHNAPFRLRSQLLVCVLFSLSFVCGRSFYLCGITDADIPDLEACLTAVGRGDIFSL